MATIRQEVGPPDRGRRISPAGFRGLDWRPGFLCEVARGVLVVTNVPGGKHAQVVDNLHEAISSYRRDHPGVIRRVGHGSEVRLVAGGLGSDRHPDPAILSRQAPTDDGGRAVVSLAIEVVSRGRRAGRRASVEKREGYLAIGLQEYWIVAPEAGAMKLLVRTDPAGVARWGERVFRGSDRIASDLLAGFAGTVAAPWEDVDAGG